MVSGPWATRLPNGVPDLKAPAPRMPDGKPDFSGMWFANVPSRDYCREKDCTGRWPIATFDADNLRTRPYACTQIEPYLTDKHLVPHFTTNIGKTGLAEPAAHVAPDRP